MSIFRCRGLNSTFSDWCSAREWLRPEICCRISTLYSQCHLVSLFQRLSEKSGHYVPVTDPKLSMTCLSPSAWCYHKNLCSHKKLSFQAQFLLETQTASRMLVQELISPSWQYSTDSHRSWFKPYIGGIQKFSAHKNAHSVDGCDSLPTRYLYHLLTILMCTCISGKCSAVKATYRAWLIGSLSPKDKQQQCFPHLTGKMAL